MNLQKSQNDIIKVGFWFNLLVIIVSIFYPKLWLFYTALALNIVLLGTHMIITKYFYLLGGLFAANKFAKKLNSNLRSLDGQVS